MANDSPQRGVLVISDDIPHTLEDMEFEMGLPREVIAQLIDEFKALGMMTGNTTFAVCNWEKRQFKSDNSSERVKAYRMKRYSNVIDTEADTESDTDNRLTEPEAAAAAPPPPIFKLYTDNIGILTPIIVERLKEMEGEYPAEWIPRAFTEAVEHNGRNLKYISAILDRWKREGPGSGKISIPKAGKQTVDVFKQSDEGRRKYALPNR